MQRKWERAQRRLRRQAGQSVPVARRAYCVTLTRAGMPEWAKRKALKALASSVQRVWLKGRADAMKLARMDQMLGGDGCVDAVEYRRCPVCDRVLLGQQATELRQWMYEHPGLKRACGAMCDAAGKGDDLCRAD